MPVSGPALHMGEPVQIFDLARDLGHLAGPDPDASRSRRLASAPARSSRKGWSTARSRFSRPQGQGPAGGRTAACGDDPRSRAPSARGGHLRPRALAEALSPEDYGAYRRDGTDLVLQALRRDPTMALLGIALLSRRRAIRLFR